MNEVLAAHSLREELIETVPSRGAMAFLGKRRQIREAMLRASSNVKTLTFAAEQKTEPTDKRMSG